VVLLLEIRFGVVSSLTFFLEPSPDSDFGLREDEESPLRRVDPAWERDSTSLDLPVSLFHIALFEMGELVGGMKHCYCCCSWVSIVSS